MTTRDDLRAHQVLTTIDNIRSMIAAENPPHNSTFRLRLCLFSVEFLHDAQRIEALFIDENGVYDFHDSQTALLQLSACERIYFTFKLTVFAPPNEPPLLHNGDMIVVPPNERPNVLQDFNFDPGDMIEMQVTNLHTHNHLCQASTHTNLMRFVDHLPDLSFEPETD